jgi:hypothetical protein
MADNPIQDDTVGECVKKNGCLALIRTAQKLLTDEKAPPETPPAHEWKLAFELLLVHHLLHHISRCTARVS